ncbi:MAG: GGDEF domain-containing protein [Arcobacteraceae bacterium]|nr:GGDEF domain-containing protein [Arcobacteraceae bacterium]
MKRKLISRFILLFVTVAIFFIIFQTYNLRNIAINSATNEAIRISQLVKDGLTSHMINGTMDKRDGFINAVTSMKEIESLWIIRGEKVTQEYGEGRESELPRDEMDKEVLKTGITQSKMNEDIFLSKASVRITIPYIATSNTQINCLQCHSVKVKDVLGAVSIELDMSYMQQMGKESLYMVSIVTILLIFLIIIITNAILKPYIETFERIGFSVKESTNGRFNNIMKPLGLTKGKEADILVDNYNYFVNELQIAFDGIDNKLKNFTGQSATCGSNSFLNTHTIINNLSDIYNFKKQIEIDTTVDEIYSRMSQILKNKFNIHNFNFTMYDDINKISTKVWTQGEEIQECNKSNDFNLCRAYKISQDVYTINDHKACACFESEDKFLHYCIPIKLMDNVTLVIRLLVNTQDEFDILKNNHITFIKKYIEEAIPAIKVKSIMTELNESVYRDSLTGLYNRKFFDEESKMLVPLAIREGFNIAVLMLDMDHFKAVNDEHGHDVGDQVLRMLGKVIKSSIRESDIAIRMGGEEFLVLLVNIDENHVLDVANKIRENVAKTPIKLANGDNFYKTISTGVSLFPTDSDNLQEVVINSDIALYEAKDSGRNKVVKFKEDMRSTIDIF